MSSGIAPMETETLSQDVTRLYEHLGKMSNSRIEQVRTGIEEACRALLRAGQPFSEILKLTTSSAVALAPLERGASPYYCGPQWSVSPDLLPAPPLSREPDRAIPGGSRVAHATPMRAEGADRALAEEWQARQQRIPCARSSHRSAAFVKAIHIPQPNPNIPDARGERPPIFLGHINRNYWPLRPISNQP